MKSISVLVIGKQWDIVTQRLLHQSFNKMLSNWGEKRTACAPTCSSGALQVGRLLRLRRLTFVICNRAETTGRKISDTTIEAFLSTFQNRNSEFLSSKSVVRLMGANFHMLRHSFFLLPIPGKKISSADFAKSPSQPENCCNIPGPVVWNITCRLFFSSTLHSNMKKI